ncbi:RNA binding domain-containing protein [Cryptosporidium ubiquitum]|uniref:Eukaryotic peptide chain release factor subunit 1 n=1 Tax=Cryptosporidium ubiquitum TaxID=857276 RepID=A0A1J4ML61_9CRYT|nr:RNA binding domain-containing protein [Cryptosporidium ubiquitum]OII73613.1 RNA binding domain-containing protein [Cryptosporidium ubiquitum]
MKLLKSKNSGNGFGYVKLKIESEDDIWELYNLILSGDSVRSITYRKTHKENTSGAVSVKVHKLVMTIIVKNTDYGGQTLRVSGFNAIDNEYVKMGQHHTMELRVGSELILYKRSWDWLARTRLEESCKKKIGAGDDILILLIGNGVANMFLVSSQKTVNLFTVNHNITRGQNNNHPYKESKNKFFQMITQNLISHLNFEDLDNIILGGPGFYKNDFFKYLMDSDNQKNKDLTGILKNKRHVFIIASTSSVFQSSIDEILLNKDFQEKLKDTKAFQQVKLIQHFQYLLATNPDLVCYGLKNTENALESNAIETLMVSDTLIRSDSLKIRSKLANITAMNNNLGGKTCVFSSTHNSGKTLENMSGIAAILRFPVDHLQDYEADDSNQGWETGDERGKDGQDEDFDWFKKEKDEIKKHQQSQQDDNCIEKQLQQVSMGDDHFLTNLKNDKEINDISSDN